MVSESTGCYRYLKNSMTREVDNKGNYSNWLRLMEITLKDSPLFIEYNSSSSSTLSSLLKVNDFSRREICLIFRLWSMQLFILDGFILFLKVLAAKIHWLNKWWFSDTHVQLFSQLSDFNSDNWKQYISMRLDDLQCFLALE